MDLSQLSSLGKVGGVPGIALGAAVSGVASHAVLCRLWRPRRGSVAGHPADPQHPGAPAPCGAARAGGTGLVRRANGEKPVDPDQTTVSANESLLV
jgi:hypothetical protein